MRLSLSLVCPLPLSVGHYVEKDLQIRSFYSLSYMIPRQHNKAPPPLVRGYVMLCDAVDDYDDTPKWPCVDVAF